MALSDAGKQRKLVDQFLAQGTPEADSGYLGRLNADINRQKAARLAQRATNRAVGLGPFAGRSPFGNSPMINPSGAGGAQVMQQGMGAVPPVRQPLALGQGVAGNLPAVPRGNVPTNIPLGQGVNALPAAAQPLALPAGAPPAPGQPFTVGQPAALGRVAGETADDLINVAGRAAAEGADDVARAAMGSAGRAAAEAGVPAARGAAFNIGKAIGGGSGFSKAGLMKGAGMAGAGLMVSQFFDGMNLGGENSMIDRTGSGAILGAGLGGGAAMAMGLASGPIGWAALGGAALFGTYQALWGDDKTTMEKMTSVVDKTRGTINELGQMYGISPEQMDDIMLQYESSTRMYMEANDGEGLKAFMGGMGAKLPAMMLMARDQDKQTAKDDQRYNNMLAAQAQFAPIFQQSMQHAQQNNQIAYQASNDAAGVFDQSNPNLAALYRQTAAQSLSAASNLHAAYAKQMVTAPAQNYDAGELERKMAQEQLLQQALAGVG